MQGVVTQVFCIPCVQVLLPIWIIVAIVDESQPRGQQSYPPAVVYNGGKPTKAGYTILAVILGVISALVLLGIGSSHPIMLISRALDAGSRPLRSRGQNPRCH